jgi:hypothetical protein
MVRRFQHDDGGGGRLLLRARRRPGHEDRDGSSEAEKRPLRLHSSL